MYCTLQNPNFSGGSMFPETGDANQKSGRRHIIQPKKLVRGGRAFLLPPNSLMIFVILFAGDNPVFSEMYVGCWSDVNDAYTRDMERLLNPSQQYWEGFTLGRCIAACHFLQYRYAAMKVCTLILYCGAIIVYRMEFSKTRWSCSWNNDQNVCAVITIQKSSKSYKIGSFLPSFHAPTCIFDVNAVSCLGF